MLNKKLTLCLVIGIWGIVSGRELTLHDGETKSFNSENGAIELQAKYCEEIKKQGSIMGTNFGLKNCTEETREFFHYNGDGEHLREQGLSLKQLKAEVFYNDEMIFDGNYEELKVKLQELNQTYTKVFLIVHGLNSLPSMVYPVKDALMAKEDKEKTLYIMPNYNYYVNGTTSYLGFVHLLGSHVNIIMEYIIEPMKDKTTDFFLIGHSLGGQTVGVLGSTMLKKYTTQPKLTVGLDAAGPIFTVLKRDFHFNSDSGVYVLSIHTSPILGIIQSNGKQDVYVNQIEKVYLECKDQGNTVYTCNHNTAITFYKEWLETKFAVLYSIDNDFSVDFVPDEFYYKNVHGQFRTYEVKGDHENTYKLNVK